MGFWRADNGTILAMRRSRKVESVPAKDYNDKKYSRCGSWETGDIGEDWIPYDL